MDITHKADYREKRAREYPPWQELADGLYWRSKGDDGPLTAYFAKIDAVKQQYKKPDKKEE